MRVRAVIRCFVLAPALAASCTFREPPPAATPAIAEVTLGLRPGGRAVLPHSMDTFSPGDTISAAVQLDGARPDTRVVARWVYIDGGSEQVVAEDVRTTAKRGSETLRFDMTNRDQWRPGRYELRVGVTGAIQETREFRVRD